METTTRECTRTAWLDLQRAVGSATLYDPKHARVRELISAHCRTVSEGLRTADRLVIELHEAGASVGREAVSVLADGPDALAAVLFSEGIRKLQFGRGYDLGAASSLVKAILPYFRTERLPEQPLSDMLRWAPIEGLAVSIAETIGRGDVSFDQMTHSEQAWRGLLLEVDPRQSETLPLEALPASWDCTGGSIPWPAPVAKEELASLDSEVDTADTSGAPMARVGMILADIVDLWVADERLGRVFDLLPGVVDGLLRNHRVGEAARLLAPLRRWGETLGDDPRAVQAKPLFDRLQARLLADQLLGLLMESILGRAIEPSKAASYFAGSGPGGPARLLEFAAATPDGPYREAMVRVVTNDLGSVPSRLEPILLKAPVGPAIVAFDVLAKLPENETGMRMALGAIHRPEPALQQRATRYLLRYDDPDVGEHMTTLLKGPREGRALALAYFTRHRKRVDFETLRALATSPKFDGLPLDERVEVARAVGFVHPRRGSDLALALLGPNWENGDLHRAAPWVICLSAAGAPEARNALVALERRSPETFADLVAEASLIWKRRSKGPATDSGPSPQPVEDRRGPPVADDREGRSVSSPRRITTKRRQTDSPLRLHTLKLDPVDLTESLIEDSSLEFHIAEAHWGEDAADDSLFPGSESVDATLKTEVDE